MNFAAVFILSAAATNLVFAFFAAFMSRAPGFKELRAFALIAGSAACFNLADVWMVLGADHARLMVAGSLAVAFGGLHGAGWIFFTAALERKPLSRLDTGLLALCLAVVGAGLVPGLTIASAHSHRVEWLNVDWHDTPPTAIGTVVYVFFVLGLGGHGVRLLARWRRGVPGAGTFTAGFAVMFLATINDVLVSMGAWHGPYLLDLGFLALVASAWRVLFLRFVDSAANLQTLSGELEREVESRTLDVSRAQEALEETDRLAALGSLASGVAHEINNPAAVVLASLEHLDALTRRGNVTVRDLLPGLDDATRATERIARIVRQLLDAGRVASGRHGLAKTFALFPCVGRAIQHLPPELMSTANFEVHVAPTLTAWGNEGLFEEALAHVVRNATQAVLRQATTGRVTLRATAVGDHVDVTVTDDGPGLSPEVRRHLFEPFSTARVGRGAGLGLAVSLGLMRAQGGELELVDSEPGRTTFRLELPATAPLEAVAPVPAPA